jgi:alkanesulfonate monooxygenase SsuD/methylene tetrahydromethanopterin reductase-like flavin-dependent oxidoreductase (luciferase family)
VVVDAYAQGFARAGFSDEVEAVRTAYASGDRAAAVAGVSDRMLDAISIVGDEKLVASAVAAYREAGVDIPVVFPVVPRNDRTERRWNPPCEPLATASTVDRRARAI